MTAMDTEARTRISTAAAARDTADWARALVDAASEDFLPGELITSARRLRILALMVLDRSVLAERAAGATWAEIAAAHNLPEAEVINRYGSVYTMWENPPADTREGLPAVHGDLTVGMVNDTDPEGLATALDMWRARHSEPWETPSENALVDLL